MGGSGETRGVGLWRPLGVGISGKANRRGNEGWVTAELLEGDRLDAALEMRLFQAWLWIRITWCAWGAIQIPGLISITAGGGEDRGICILTTHPQANSRRIQVWKVLLYRMFGSEEEEEILAPPIWMLLKIRGLREYGHWSGDEGEDSRQWPAFIPAPGLFYFPSPAHQNQMC